MGHSQDAEASCATNRPDATFSHDACDSLLADLFARLSKIEEHPRTSVDRTAGRMRLSDELGETFVFDRTIRQGAMNPGIEAASCDPEHSAHRLDREPFTMSMDEGVLYS